jgi:hypothetical protein
MPSGKKRKRHKEAQKSKPTQEEISRSKVRLTAALFL